FADRASGGEEVLNDKDVFARDDVFVASVEGEGFGWAFSFFFGVGGKYVSSSNSGIKMVGNPLGENNAPKNRTYDNVDGLMIVGPGHELAKSGDGGRSEIEGVFIDVYRAMATGSVDKVAIGYDGSGVGEHLHNFGLVHYLPPQVIIFSLTEF